MAFKCNIGQIFGLQSIPIALTRKKFDYVCSADSLSLWIAVFRKGSRGSVQNPMLWLNSVSSFPFIHSHSIRRHMAALGYENSQMILSVRDSTWMAVNSFIFPWFCLILTNENVSSAKLEKLLNYSDKILSFLSYQSFYEDEFSV